MIKPEFSTHIIDNIQDFDKLKRYVEAVNSKVLSLDVETNSVSEKTAKLFGIGLCFNDKKAFYITWRRKDSTQVWSKEQEITISQWLLDISTKFCLIGHNIIYDVLVLENNLGIDLSPNIYSDTILQKHTLEEEMPFGLKEIAVRELGEWADKAQDALKENVIANGGRFVKDQKDMYLADTTILAEYCCFDVILTYLLFNIYESRLIEEDLYDLFYVEEIMPLYKNVTINMKRKGFMIDLAYFNNLKSELLEQIDRIESEIMTEISKDISKFEQEILDKNYPIKTTGLFPVKLANKLGIPLPVSAKTGKVTLAKKAIEKQLELTPSHASFYNTVMNNTSYDISVAILQETQREMLLADENRKYVFNLASNDHLAHLICKVWKLNPQEKTEGGKPKIDDDFLELVAKRKDAAKKLLDYKKLNKLLSTYVEGILSRQVDSYVYTSMLQHGTTSGRFSSRDPNLQNLPRVKEEDSGLSPLVLNYVNSIKKGFIAPKGYKILNADYSSLEPICFAHMSGDERLRDVFRHGEDLYSRIAIDVFDLPEYSAIKKDPNYLGLHEKEARQKSKAFCLAVVYGAEASRIREIMSVSWQEANSIIYKYVDAYPNLTRYLNSCNYEAKKFGIVKTEFGRVRHLKQARLTSVMYDNDEILDYKWAAKRGLEQVRREYKNLLNNAKNFKIQGLAAHIVNRSMIALENAFKINNINGWISMQVHDEITCIVDESQLELATKLMRDCMENTIKISVDLKAEPVIANNWAEAK